ncbi:MAG: hypothetical protein IKT00_01240 [Prevotella sp.]|nr:hypothetical protein [Prevotella sp.]
MPNKKALKKTINNICNDVLSECIAVSLYSGHADPSTVEALITSIIITRNDFVSRISHPEPGMKPKVYYDQLAADFSKQMTEILDQLNALSE